MTYPHPAAQSDEELLSDCQVQRLRRGGPGGQHRNKVETAVVLEHKPTEVRAEANERRSQAQNQKQALFRLRLQLAIRIRSDSAAVRNHSPSALWTSRCQAQRIVVSTCHEDFPHLLAEVLDQLHAHDYELGLAAKELEVTSSQLAKFLQKEPAAWNLLNRQRQERGLRPLK